MRPASGISQPRRDDPARTRRRAGLARDDPDESEEAAPQISRSAPTIASSADRPNVDVTAEISAAQQQLGLATDEKKRDAAPTATM